MQMSMSLKYEPSQSPTHSLTLCSNSLHQSFKSKSCFYKILPKNNSNLNCVGKVLNLDRGAHRVRPLEGRGVRETLEGEVVPRARMCF